MASRAQSVFWIFKENPMPIRTLSIVSLALAAALNAQQPMPRRSGPGGPDARFLGAEAGAAGRVVRNAPYSADIVTETSQSLTDGNRIKQSNTVHVYRDSDGRTRREQSLQGLGGLAAGSNAGSLPQVAFINDPVAGASYALDLTNRTATKTHRVPSGNSPGGMMPRRVGGGDGAAPRPQMQMRRSSQNVKTESLGRQLIEGVQADGIRTTMTIPAGQIGNEQPIQVVSETWYSPELQTVVLRKRSDPRSGDTVTRYMNISRAEPPRTLFEVPADFKIGETGIRPRSKQ
jgi:hypothetical protein